MRLIKRKYEACVYGWVNVGGPGAMAQAYAQRPT